jgi:hypothetical protein
VLAYIKPELLYGGPSAVLPINSSSGCHVAAFSDCSLQQLQDALHATCMSLVGGYSSQVSNPSAATVAFHDLCIANMLCLQAGLGQLLTRVWLTPPGNNSSNSEICLRLMDVLPLSNTSTSARQTAANGAAIVTETGMSPYGTSAMRTNNSIGKLNRTAWYFSFNNFRFVPVARRSATPRPRAWGSGPLDRHSSTVEYARTADLKGVPEGMPLDAIGVLGTTAEPARYEHFQPSAAMLHLERLVRQETIAAARAKSGNKAASSSAARGAPFAAKSPQLLWQQLQQKYNWVDGQLVFRSLYRPCLGNTFGGCIETCG